MKDYPSKEGNWCVEELETLGKSLGYHPKVLIDHLPLSNATIRFEDLSLILQGDLLYPVLHKTFNHQDGSYNLKVVAKAIHLLQKRYLSFSQLRNSRVSFQTYECSDHAGLEDKLVMRSLKLCNKVMAPERLRLLLQHMDRLVSDRLMLYEFLDLVASADSLEVVDNDMVPKKEISDKLDKRALYDLCEFKEELITHDDRRLKYLDKQFEEILKIIPVSKNTTNEISAATQQWATPPLVNKTVRKNMVDKSKNEGKCINKHLEPTHIKLKMCNSGCKCQCCPQTEVSPKKKIYVCSKPIQIQDLSTTDGFTMGKPCLVTTQEKEETKQKIQNMQWKIATQRHSPMKSSMDKTNDF